MAEVMPALWALYLAWAVMKKKPSIKMRIIIIYVLPAHSIARKPSGFYKNSFYTE